MPSHHTPPSGVSATLVKIVLRGERRHRVGIGFLRRPRRHAKKSGLGIDGAQPALRIGLDPRDVVSHRPDFPVLQSPSGGTIMAKLVLPQELGKAAAT